jgi:hypothetical protein
VRRPGRRGALLLPPAHEHARGGEALKPEEAAAEARRRAEEARARGGYGEDLERFAVEPLDKVDVEHLLEWAVIEPDVDLVYSTRRYGRPITAVKRALVWTLRQYNGQAFAQQTRFNIQLALFTGQLAARIEGLEDEVEKLRRAQDP